MNVNNNVLQAFYQAWNTGVARTEDLFEMTNEMVMLGYSKEAEWLKNNPHLFAEFLNMHFIPYLENETKTVWHN